MAQTKRETLVLKVGGYAKGQLPFDVKQPHAKDSRWRNGTRRFNGCRRKRVQRNMSNKLHIGTCNVQTNNIKQDICQMKIKNWIACVRDRGKWKDGGEKDKTFHH